MLEKAVEAELQPLLDQYEKVTALGGRKLMVRNDYLPKREGLTVLGPVQVRVPKVRDRSGSDGYRESKASWLGVIQDLQARGLKAPPHLAIGDGALGFWVAWEAAWPQTCRQRCRVHKTANVLNELIHSGQGPSGPP